MVRVLAKYFWMVGALHRKRSRYLNFKFICPVVTPTINNIPQVPDSAFHKRYPTFVFLLGIIIIYAHKICRISFLLLFVLM